MAEEKNALPEGYGEFLTALFNEFLQAAGLTGDAAGKIRENLTASLRPGYEKQAAARRQATLRQQAEVDADAAARGMGASSWVTDAKSKLKAAEANDIAGLWEDYAAELIRGLTDALSDMEERKDQVRKSAMDRAEELFPAWYAAAYGPKTAPGPSQEEPKKAKRKSTAGSSAASAGSTAGTLSGGGLAARLPVLSGADAGSRRWR